jgi:hypothetical protein
MACSSPWPEDWASGRSEYIFFSALIAYTLGLSLGILMGSRKMARYGEG